MEKDLIRLEEAAAIMSDTVTCRRASSCRPELVVFKKVRLVEQALTFHDNCEFSHPTRSSLCVIPLFVIRPVQD